MTCPWCQRPLATDADNDREGCGDDCAHCGALCWAPFHSEPCPFEPRGLAAEVLKLRSSLATVQERAAIAARSDAYWQARAAVAEHDLEEERGRVWTMAERASAYLATSAALNRRIRNQRRELGVVNASIRRIVQQWEEASRAHRRRREWARRWKRVAKRLWNLAAAYKQGVDECAHDANVAEAALRERDAQLAIMRARCREELIRAGVNPDGVDR